MPASKQRKRKYEGRFFYQGVIAPAKMELCFGFYDRAAIRLAAIKLDNDSLFTPKAIAYKEALFLFASGMDAVKKGRTNEAKGFVNALDALLWRNSNQESNKGIISPRHLNELNVASLELQGVIKSAENKYIEAIQLLEKAKDNEDELGYSEPPSYARPVLISLAEAHLKAGKFDEAQKAYEILLERHPHTANGYWGLYKVYKQRGDILKAKEYAKLLEDITKFSNKELFPL
ncbi:MAG: tetratricopeptide repeat protein [Runella zeae]